MGLLLGISIICGSVLLFCLYKIVELSSSDDKKKEPTLTRYRVIEEKFLNGETWYQIQYFDKDNNKWTLYQGSWSNSYRTLERAKAETERLIKNDLESYARTKVLNSKVVLESKEIQL
jgi:hypothetical protein